MPVIVRCKQCDKEFSTCLSNIKRGGGKYCSRECLSISSEWRLKQANAHNGKHCGVETRSKISIAIKGQTRSAETRAKMSASKRGSVFSSEHRAKLSDAKKGKPSPNLGKRFCDEHRAKLSKAHAGPRELNKCLQCGKEISLHPNAVARGRGSFCSKSCGSKYRRGPLSPAWRGGTSFAPYCEKFNDACRERVREEFGHRCIVCGLRESENCTKNGFHRKLSVHHIRYDKQEGCNGNDFFLVPLCMSCHTKTSNGDRVYWEREITEKRTQYLNADEHS